MLHSRAFFLRVVCVSALLLSARLVAAQSAVTLSEDAKVYTLDNGLVRAQIAKDSGDLVSLRYKDTEMLASFLKEDGSVDLEKDPPGHNVAGVNRGMTDHQYGFWSHDAMGVRDTAPAVPKVTIDPKSNNGERAEVSIVGISNGRKMGTGPGARGGMFIADIDIRWSLGRGDSGVYTSCTFNHPESYGDTTMGEARFCAKLADFFDWMLVSDEKNKLHPKENYRENKYINTVIQFDNPAYGWASTTKNVGFFILNPSMEYMSGGPTKVDFLAHRDTNAVAAPCVLNYWRSSHYGGSSVDVAAGEKWTKTIGPFMLYVNSGTDPQAIYADARARQQVEAGKWPYQWVSLPDYVHADKRGSVEGRIAIQDPVQAAGGVSNLLVGLAHAPYHITVDRAASVNMPVDITWNLDAKHYEFWVRGGNDGKFAIKNVIPGTYTLYAIANGVLGEFSKADVTVNAGQSINLGELSWTPGRRGRQVWELGIMDRSAREFRGGEDYTNAQVMQNFSQWFPNGVNFKIGESNIKTDWFLRHTARGPDDAWKITFDMPQAATGTATLRLALAGKQASTVDVTLNGEPVGQATGLWQDSSLGRFHHRGIWEEREISFDASKLKTGENVIGLVPSSGGVMYDYLRLELNP